MERPFTETLAKTQVSVLASYSMPFVLGFAFVINAILASFHVLEGPLRLIFLSSSFPSGFSVGRFIYVKRAHVEISFDDNGFQVVKGSRKLSSGFWKSYRLVSIVLDNYGRANLRLYESVGGEHVDLPISKTNANPQEFRNYVQSLVMGQKARQASPQVVEAS